uniref:SLAM family member 6 n=1 Tax=Nannospalax galili TaxID=1026970 RepID=A0A8C6RRE1_NANGA
VAASGSPAPISTLQRMIWLFPLVFCLVSGKMESQSNSTLFVVNGVLGESVILPLELSARKEVNLIIWHYHPEASPAIAIIVININEFKIPQIITANPERKTRLNVTQSYSLQFNNLTMADSGFYTAQITLKSSEMEVSSYVLRVLKRLSNLQVSNHIQLSEKGTCEIHLVCTVENLKCAESFGWLASGNISLSESNLTVSWDPTNSSDLNYTCIAENSVSNLSVTVSAQSLCKDVFPKENLHWDNIWTIIIVSIGIIILVFIYAWKKRTGSLSLATQHLASSQNTEYTLGSPGSTVYAQVTHPNQRMDNPTYIKNDSVTIYSIINHSREGNCS